MKRKNVKELLPILKAYAEWKQIQFFCGTGWEDKDELSFDSDPSKYRIKPESKYRPFKSVEECWQEMHKHSDFGWIKNKKEKDYYNIVNISKNSEDTEVIINAFPYTFTALFISFTFIDGSPFGIKEE